MRVLKEIYELRKLTIRPKPKDDLELLSNLEIIRPFMLQRLIDIRNIVEHQDSSPPPADECLMYADLVWYFLRTTDGLTYVKIDNVLFAPPGVGISPEQYYPSVELTFENLSEPPRLRMWLNSPGFTYKPNENWMKIQPIMIEGFKAEGEEQPSRFVIDGEIRGTEHQMLRIYRLYFRANHQP